MMEHDYFHILLVATKLTATPGNGNRITAMPVSNNANRNQGTGTAGKTKVLVNKNLVFVPTNSQQ